MGKDDSRDFSKEECTRLCNENPKEEEPSPKKSSRPEAKAGPASISSKLDKQAIQGKVQNKVEALGQNAKALLSKASVYVEKSGPLKQLAVGTGAGWCTGFLSTRVGKVAAISVGGSIILVAGASQTGLININWPELGEKAGKIKETATDSIKKGQQSPQFANIAKYARHNRYFAAGFMGGFLLGICS